MVKEKELKNSFGYEDDEIFLLSIDEYKKYKDVIPLYKECWWLRSSADCNGNSATVHRDGLLDEFGFSIDVNLCVRPAIKFDNTLDYKIGTRFVKYDFPWIVIDNGLAIAEIPISYEIFDKTKYDYKKSYIRMFLMDWLTCRKNS